MTSPPGLEIVIRLHPQEHDPQGMSTDADGLQDVGSIQCSRCGLKWLRVWESGDWVRLPSLLDPTPGTHDGAEMLCWVRAHLREHGNLDGDRLVAADTMLALGGLAALPWARV